MKKQKSHIVWEGETHQIANAPKAQFGGKLSYPELITEAELEAEQRKLQSLISPHEILLPQEISVPPLQKRREKKAMEKIIESFQSFVANFLEWLSPAKRRKLLTARGKRALSELTSLWELYLATCVADGMDSVLLEASFGEAYYAIMQESKRHYARHKGERPHEENYSSYIEHFARHASNIA